VVPDAGFQIPGIITVGLTLDYEVGFTASNWHGNAAVSYGVTAGLPDSSLLKVDLISPNKSSFSGWEPTFRQLPLKIDAQASGDVQVYSQPAVAVELVLFGILVPQPKH
jgi:hypothetical protein